jgi:hypothetical protein
MRHEFITSSCEEFLGLNREELRRWRWVLAYEQLRDLRSILQELDQEGTTGGLAKQIAEGAIRRMTQADHPYAAMVRYFVNVEWAMAL